MNRAIQIKAMASQTRMSILQLLADPQQNFCHQQSADPAEFGVCMTLIADALGLAQPTVSRHLDILRQAGFLSIARQHKWSYCKRDDGAIRNYLDWVGQELAIADEAAG